MPPTTMYNVFQYHNYHSPFKPNAASAYVRLSFNSLTSTPNYIEYAVVPSSQNYFLNSLATTYTANLGVACAVYDSTATGGSVTTGYEPDMYQSPAKLSTTYGFYPSYMSPSLVIKMDRQSSGTLYKVSQVTTIFSFLGSLFAFVGTVLAFFKVLLVIVEDLIGIKYDNNAYIA